MGATSGASSSSPGPSDHQTLMGALRVEARVKVGASMKGGSFPSGAGLSRQPLPASLAAILTWELFFAKYYYPSKAQGFSTATCMQCMQAWSRLLRAAVQVSCKHWPVLIHIPSLYYACRVDILHSGANTTEEPSSLGPDRLHRGRICHCFRHLPSPRHLVKKRKTRNR